MWCCQHKNYEGCRPPNSHGGEFSNTYVEGREERNVELKHKDPPVPYMLFPPTSSCLLFNFYFMLSLPSNNIN